MGEDDLALFRRDNVGIVFQDFSFDPNYDRTGKCGYAHGNWPDVKMRFEQAKAGLEGGGVLDIVSPIIPHSFPVVNSNGSHSPVRWLLNQDCFWRIEPTGNLDGETGEDDYGKCSFPFLVIWALP